MFLSGVIIAYILFLTGTTFIANQNYKMLTNKSSPNGKYIVTEYSSRREGGHAPYGQHLVLEPKGMTKDPDHGHIIFAGYCNPRPNYFWGSNSKIVIECKTDSNKSILTSSTLAFGIDIEIIGIEKAHQ